MVLPKRKNTRLEHYSYTLAGYYFTTICTHNRRPLLGSFTDGVFVPNSTGLMAQECLEEIPLHHPLTRIDEYIIMPNHLHAIIVLEWEAAGDAGVAPTRARAKGNPAITDSPGASKHSLGAIIGSFKAAVSRKLAWKKRNSHPLWQRGFYDHIIRTEEGLQTVREYIVNNPLSWHLDDLNARRSGTHQFYDWLSSQQRP